MILLLLACGAPSLESDWVDGPTLTLLSDNRRGNSNPFVLVTPVWEGQSLNAEMDIEVELRMSGAGAKVWAWLIVTGEDPTVPDVQSPLSYSPVEFTADDEPLVIGNYTSGDCGWSDYGVAQSGTTEDVGCSLSWQLYAELRSGAAANVATRVRGLASFYGDDAEGVDLGESRIEAGWSP